MKDKSAERSDERNAEIVLRVSDLKMAKRLGALLLSEMDLRLAKHWFLFASMPRDDGDEYEAMLRNDALFHAALVAYRRCFNSGQRSALQREHAKKVFEGGEKIHDRLIELGNRMIAHLSIEFEAAKVGARCLVDRELDVHAYVDTWGIVLKTMIFKPDELEEFSLLCHKLETEYVHPQIEEIRKLLHEQFLQTSPEELFSMPEFRVVDETGATHNPLRWHDTDIDSGS